MAEQLIECVPNFSEGQNMDIINLITDQIKNTEGVRLLDVDPGYEMNRTVVTFVGPPAGVKEAAFKAIKKAAELIDMRKHKGSHPRMGATDVCPFVPVSGISTEACIRLSEEVAERVGKELNIPVFLYEKSARTPQRENLARIRSGEYEGLAEKLKKEEWRPDFGPTEFNAGAGATVIGVREFLIAYNISLNTSEEKFATDIAFELREKGRSARRGNIVPFYFKGGDILKYGKDQYPCGSCELTATALPELVKHCSDVHGYDLIRLLKLNAIDPSQPEGTSVKKPGLFTYCKAIGWMVPEYKRAQISINLTNYNITPMHAVLEATRELAAQRGLVVTGSEIVGMVPYPALLQSGKYYLQKQKRSTGIPVTDILETAIQSLGLRDVSGFDINERVLGLPGSAKTDLIEMKVKDFVDEVSRESPAPGGGSIAALAGALGAALTSMVSNLSIGKRGSEAVEDDLQLIAERMQEIKDALLRGVDQDTNAFNAYMAARRLPGNSKEDKELRNRAMQAGLKEAIEVPLQTARLCAEIISLADTVVDKGNINSVTDVGVGIHIAYSGVKGGVFNVLINLKEITDPAYVQDMINTCRELEDSVKKTVDDMMARVNQKILQRMGK
ncbi:MAG: glutamate formimidoyltransferase [Calditrichales bacterium]|nr:MAG: glutamate formimidoyltransferase [Calditrichales bacterium]